MLLAEVIDAEEALRIGLANRVVADADVLSPATELALCLAGQSPLAVHEPDVRSTPGGSVIPTIALL
jgi:enoyl-CoA hydratase/carnithine racemase